MSIVVENDDGTMTGAYEVVVCWDEVVVVPEEDASSEPHEVPTSSSTTTPATAMSIRLLAMEPTVRPAG